jgi:hypothetical protein
MFGHDMFTHFYAEGDAEAMMTDARWFDKSIENYPFAEGDDDGIYQGRSWFWNICGGMDYTIYQTVHQRNKHYLDDRDGKYEKIVTFVRKMGESDSIYSKTHTQQYSFADDCEEELDSLEESFINPCFSQHNRNTAANDQARKAIKWLEDKFPDKVCTGDEKIYTPAEWDKVVESQQDEDENGDEDATEEPDNTKLYLIIGGVVVIGGIVAYQMSQG